MTSRERHHGPVVEPSMPRTGDAEPDTSAPITPTGSGPDVAALADAGTAEVPAQARELARSLVRVTLVNVTLALLVAVTNWDTYPGWARAGVVAASVAAAAVGAVLRRRALATPADADGRALKRLGRRLLAALLTTHLPLMALAAAGVLSR